MSINISDKKAICCVTTIKESNRAAEIVCNYFHKISGGDFKISDETLERNNIIFNLTDDMEIAVSPIKYKNGELYKDFRIIRTNC